MLEGVLALVFLHQSAQDVLGMKEEDLAPE
jgi:hypothetical protein